MTHPERAQPLVSDPAEIIAGVGRLNTDWALRYAVITDVVSAAAAVGTYHGDELNEVPFISLVGQLLAGQRVAVLFIPPSGNYVIASLSGPAVSRLLDALETNVAATDTTVGAAELDLTRLAMPNISVVAGELYRLDLQVITTQTVAANEFEFRLRGVTALVGTVLGSALSWGVSTTAGQCFKASIYWTATATETLDLFTSVIRNSGAGTITIFYQNFGQLTRTHAALYWVGSGTTLRTITT